MAQPIETIAQLFYQAVERNLPDALASKRNGAFVPMSHVEMTALVERLALAMAARGLKVGDRVAIMSENRPEWAITDFACAIQGLPDVTIYCTLNAPQAAFILKDSQARWVICSDRTQLDKVLTHWSELPHLEVAVLMDGELPEGTGRTLISWAVLQNEGLAMEDRRPEVRAWGAQRKASDILTLIYTSGTTADPKGAMLTHGNLVTNVLAAEATVDFIDDERALSFLPLTHIFERMAGQFLWFHIGAAIYYAESVNTVAADLLEVRPTVMASVPRIYEKIYAKIYDTVSSGPFIKRLIFHWAMQAGRQALPYLLKNQEPPSWKGAWYRAARTVVFEKIRQRTGGRLKVAVSGGAPLGGKIMEFFWILGIPILEGYGLTETSPIITVNRFGEVQPGSVGRPLYKEWNGRPFVKIAVDGEILCQGPNIMQGYWNNETATREAIDDDGYFHTGDIGHFDDSGRLYITDRKKELIVTSGGKKVAPQPIENKLKEDKYISQAVLIGDQRNFITALIVPNFDSLVRWAGYKKIPVKSLSALVKDPQVYAKLGSRVERVNEQLSNYERIKKIVILDQEMTLEGGQLTPSLKVKRRVVNQMYSAQIEAMYKEAKD
ncbi:long-chain fatty acid--CoA ligase [Geothrix sp. PMB-07]|uniref:AMP-dependent synthetase/ligase n=1 Tax=Geothrix sp. PMB-07 TaxID=3068640 RepID=UPI0027406691|nr:long-chain fatty acid--CoA ligase [Geothrix sp. PMB-07]WLT33253.1 long-chain fatty acid--CoA ligase [Geothrix sp. PMB-07]